jgi:phthalate 4,5-dioxygenase
MLSKDLNELLTRTGAGTSMGRLIRRYWVPALLSEELPGPDCPAVQVRLMGEELAAFRDSQGHIGLLEEHRLHRGASLFQGPLHAGYPTHEAAGIIFAYLGPDEKKPLFPNYDFALLPLERTYVTKALMECNYLQGLEGECDSAHLSWLHREFRGGGQQALYAADAAPDYYTEDTDFGVRLVATRHPQPDATYVRVSSFVLPVCGWVPAGHRKEAHFYVPCDDTHTWRYDLGFMRARPIIESDLHRRKQIGPDYHRLRTKANHYLQDRQAQRTEDFTGIEDFLNEDACATETMGAIYDRSREHLGASDKGVIAVRRRLLDIVQALDAGQEPPHLIADPSANDMAHVDTLAEVIPADRHWREHFPHLSLSGEGG